MVLLNVTKELEGFKSEICVLIQIIKPKTIELCVINPRKKFLFPESLFDTLHV